MRERLEPLGDSLIVAGSGGRARVHIHTDEPARVFAMLSAAGRVVQQKVDDMRLQYSVAHERRYPIAIVTESVCDLQARPTRSLPGSRSSRSICASTRASTSMD